MAPGELAGLTGAGVRAAEQASGVAKSYVASAGSTTTMTYASAVAGHVGLMFRLENCSDSQNDNKDVFAVLLTGTTMTFWPALPAAVAAGDTLIPVTNPYPLAIEDGGGGATVTVTDGTLTWSNAIAVGLFATCIYSAGSIVVGESSEITANTAGVLTVDAFSANVTDDDVFLIGKYVAAEELDPGLGQNMIPRPRIGDSGQTANDFAAERRPGPSFKLPIKGLNDDACGDGEDWATKKHTPSMWLLRAMLGTVTDDEGEVTAAAGTITTRVLGTGKGDEQFTAGSGVLSNGEFSVISSITDGGVGNDTLNMVAASGGGPAFSAAAAVAEEVYASRMFRVANNGGHYPLSFIYFADQVTHFAHCCYGKPSLEVQPGGRVVLQATFEQCQAWSSRNFACPTSLNASHYPEDSVSELKIHNHRVELDATDIEISGFTFEWGTEITERKDPSVLGGWRGGFISQGEPMLTLQGSPKENEKWLRYRELMTNVQTLVQVGYQGGRCFSNFLPQGQITEVSMEQNGGIATQTLTIKGRKPLAGDPLQDQVRSYHT